MIYVGQVLPGRGMAYGFGRDAYDEMRVEAIGADWVVARDPQGVAWFALGTPEDIARDVERETGRIERER